MTILAAIRTSKGIYIASDSQVTRSDIPIDINRATGKWILSHDERSAIGFAGDAACIPVIHRNSKEIFSHNCPIELCENLRILLEERGIEDKCEFVLVHLGIVYSFGNSFMPIMQNEAFVGSGSVFAMSAYSVCSEKKTKKRLKIAVKEACLRDIYSGGNIFVSKMKV